MLARVDLVATGPLIALLIGGLLVAGIGLIDDRYGLPAGIRLAVHLAAAIVAIEYVGVPPLRLGEHVIAPSWVGYLLSVTAIVWSLNLFNFMDGIDGIAASEAAFVSSAAACIAWFSHAAPASIAGPLVVAAACCGFLLWNWPPAKIFMGDVGSGYLGYAIAVLALDAAQRDSAAIWWWLICGGVFFVDATITLIRRGLRRERVLEAHRTHAYQWLARRWGNHARVTLAVMAANLFWLAPWAFAAAAYPYLAAYFTVAALAPLIFVALWAGAGRPSGS
jgi:Fuc2NAc and GlcNAc transferase